MKMVRRSTCSNAHFFCIRTTSSAVDTVTSFMSTVTGSFLIESSKTTFSLRGSESDLIACLNGVFTNLMSVATSPLARRLLASWMSLLAGLAVGGVSAGVIALFGQRVAANDVHQRGALERLQVMDLVLRIVRLGREGQGEFLRSHVPLLQLLVLHPFLEILLPITVGQSHAGQQQAQRQEDGKESAARGSNGSIHVHGDDPLYTLFVSPGRQLLKLFDERHAIDFVQRRLSSEDQSQRGLAQCPQSFSGREAAHFRAGFTVDNRLADTVGHVEQFMDRRASAVARVVADFATGVGEKGVVAELRRRQP